MFIAVLSTLAHIVKKTSLLKDKQSPIKHVKHAGANPGPIDQESQPQSYLMVSVLYSVGPSNLIFNVYIPFE